MKTVIVAGSVGSGKTTISKRLAKKINFTYIDLNDIIAKNNLDSGYDKKRKCKIIDIKKLNNFLIKRLIKNKNFKGIIIDSHLSHYLPNKYVDLCIVTQCKLRILEKRLKKRKYDKDKIRENMDVEIFDNCLNEAKAFNHNLLVIDTTQGINIGDLTSTVKRLLK